MLAAAALALPACRTGRRFDADIIVVGAGLAGLHAAMLLQDEGRDVLVVDAARRVGGRMLTLEHEGGRTEGGGQQIGASYARVIDTAQRLGVPLYTEARSQVGTRYHVGGDWMEADRLIVDAFPKAYRNTPPGSLLFRLLAAEDPAFTAPDDWLSADPKFDVSARDFLAARGFSIEAIALVDRTLNGNDVDSYSMLNLHRTWQLYRQSSGMGATRYVEGGSQRLPEAMAASLARPVRLSTRVTRITENADGVTLEHEGGRLRAAHCLYAAPYSATGRAVLDAPLDPVQREALSKLPYTQIVQHHYGLNGAAASIWADTPVERFFVDTGRDGAPTGFARGWLNGRGAVGQGQRIDTYTSAIANIAPELARRIAPLVSVDWTVANPLAGGAYFHWAPGQAARWADVMGRSTRRLHFAGEHLGRLHTGMEAAMESAESAVLRLMGL